MLLVQYIDGIMDNLFLNFKNQTRACYSIFKVMKVKDKHVLMKQTVLPFIEIVFGAYLL